MPSVWRQVCHRVAGFKPLHAQPLPVRIYGVGEQPAQDHLHFMAVDPEGFVADLAACSALVATAGNTLIGEALYLGKPIFALPESGNIEQQIHAHFIAHSGCGEVADMASVEAATLAGFLARLGQFQPYAHRHRLQGLEASIDAIYQTLSNSPSPRRSRVRASLGTDPANPS